MGIRIKQRDITDCGAACLASVAGYYKLKLPLSKIRLLASTGQKGTNVLGLVEASEKLGFSAKALRGDFESLGLSPKPTIVHLMINNALHHYMVVYKIGKRFVKLMDPMDGIMRKMSHEEFKEMWTGVMVILMPNEEFKAMDHRVSVARRFWFLISPHKSVLLQTMVGALIYSVLGLSISIYLQKIVDNVFIDRNANLLNLMSVAMVVLLLFQIFIGSYNRFFTLKVGQKIDARLILGYYKHLMTLPQRFFDTMRVGEIISRINDAVKIRAFINEVSVGLMVNGFVVLFSFALMFALYWKLALVMILIMPFYFLIYVLTNKVNKKAERNLMEKSASLETQMVESVRSVGLIKKFGVEDYAKLRTESKFVSVLDAVYKSGLNNVFSTNATDLILRLFTIVLLWVGAGYVIGNEISPGELVAFYAIMGYLTGPVASLVGMNKSVHNAMIAADRLFEIMDLEMEEDAAEKFDLEPSSIGDIVFQNVTFRYGSHAKVFDGLDLHIPKGKITGVVGESGSGKSTLLALLQHIYPVESGQIKIGQYDIAYVSHHSLRKQIAVVPQQVELISGSLIENIAFGDLRPNVKKIIEICHLLGMTGFIEALPGGISSHLGEYGISLSGGQRQLVSIARAMYRDPEILILDEASASLDPKSQKNLQSVIKLLSNRGKTIIFITHHLTSVKDFDQIIVMDDGSVVEQGSHDSLVGLEGKYHEMIFR
ncbi:peptidase domain-containing ABC transporter [Echinicola marina]|uniref:peptidase domain-containing ABC transporter n=1 Tax=Echinicola marina TaxID=2859768 RepID=UPI001CF6435D|nr:peptidase domain-containing ABC transporter [Echinicola marina]UCS95129.1 peptidase domain-containing ABC transporter [Echinicola marina]